MKKHRCIWSEKGHGDCYRACIASILDIKPQKVPLFGHPNREAWVDEAIEWLRGLDLGLSTLRLEHPGWSLQDVFNYVSLRAVDVPQILIGQCEVDPSSNHAVVMMNGRIVHDPSDAGVSGPCPDRGSDGSAAWFVHTIAVNRTWKTPKRWSKRDA